MTEWSLSQLMSSLHQDIEQRLEISRKTLGHPGAKGDASENVWISMLKEYLPSRYQVAKAHVVDSEGTFSEQMDVVVFDRQYTPFIFKFEEQTIIPAESVYAVFEAKQTANAALVNYAQEKVKSVRRLKKTSLPIPYAGGVYPAKAAIPIIGGFLAFESDWRPPLGTSLEKSLATDNLDKELQIGCIAAHGTFSQREDGGYDLNSNTKPATAFLFELIARLQFSGTVPMIDIDSYGKWLAPEDSARKD